MPSVLIWVWFQPSHSVLQAQILFLVYMVVVKNIDCLPLLQESLHQNKKTYEWKIRNDRSVEKINGIQLRWLLCLLCLWEWRQRACVTHLWLLWFLLLPYLLWPFPEWYHSWRLMGMQKLCCSCLTDSTSKWNSKWQHRLYFSDWGVRK